MLPVDILAIQSQVDLWLTAKTSNLNQKWVKTYDGFGDPYDHLASFNQLVRVEKILDVHTQVEGFGMTLEWKALSW